VAACRQAYRASGPAALAKPNVKLIACAQNTGHSGMVDGVYVYVATGKPRQCESLGMYPLPAGYTAAQARVHALVRALGAVYHRHDCVSPAALAREVQGVLDQLGFSGWHTRQMLDFSPSTSDGPCGTFPGAGTPHGDVASDPAAAVDGGAHVVIIQNGRPQAMSPVIETEGPRLLTESGRRCYSAAAVRKLALTSLAHAHVPILFATSAELKGQQFDPARQTQYNSGCVVIVTVNTAADGHTIDVWLNSRSTPTLPAGEGQPSPRDYAP